MKTQPLCSSLAALLLLISSEAVQAQFDYTVDDGKVTITKYTGPGGAVAIPDTIQGMPVTSIDWCAFDGCTSLTTIILPDGLISIGDGAFGGCTNLTGIMIPGSVSSIGYWAFRDCTSLTSVTIPSGVTNLPTFWDGEGVDQFLGCKSLIEITVDSLNPAYSSRDGVLFDKSQATVLLCPEGRAGSYAIPDTVTNIGPYAFFGCAGLTSVTIPDGITSIGHAAFGGCTGMTNITIPSSVTSIGYVASAFDLWESLQAIAVDPLNPLYNSVDGVLFDKNQNVILKCPTSKAGSYTIPKSVTRIDCWAFAECKSLTSVTLPDGLSSIGTCAFDNCTGLVSIRIPHNVTSLGHFGFAGCTSLTSIKIESNAPDITPYTFARSSNVIVYYLPGTTGWDSTFGGRPTALWLPQIVNSDADFSAYDSRFGFTIDWAGERVVVVEACTDLANPSWSVVGSVTLANGSGSFSDPDWANYPGRFYRLRWQ